MDSSETPNELTQLLHRWGEGDRGALDRLVELVYPELHRIAARHLQRERGGHTLASTALVHEAYLRLAQQPEKQWANRTHFFAVAARVIRSILVDYARARQTAKRGGGGAAVTLSEALLSREPGEVDLLDLDTALKDLSALDGQQSQIVELRFFGGLSIEETAAVLRISPSTVKRDWLLAKTWIKRRLERGLAGGAPVEA